MTSKKQSKAFEQKRHEQLQRKIADAKARKQRNTRIAAFTVGGVALVALIVIIVVALTRGDDSAAPVPSASPTPAATSTQGTEPSTQPSNDGNAEPTDAATSEPETGDDEAQTEGWTNSMTPPGPELALDKVWTVALDTNQGPITLELDGVHAPQAVASFISLAKEGFFDNTDCHRLTTAGIFVLQCGDPTGTGTGGPGYRFGPVENAPADDLYTAGTLAMARVPNNADSMGSQFFVVYDDSTIPSDSAGGYTVFGKVTQGLAIVEDVAQAGTILGGTDGRPAESVIINEVSVS